MSERRRDSKNRVLRTGETQRKDGRYRYTYTDAGGQTQSVYSWRLVSTDPLPSGKRDCIPLRDQEKLIQRDLSDGIISSGGDLTVYQLAKRYIDTKTGVRHNTEANYNFVLNILKKEDFGSRRIDKIKETDARLWLVKLQDDGRGYSTIHSVRGVVRPAFEMAVKDDLIRKNPFNFQLATVVINDSATREAITRKQERAFLNFIKQDKHFCKYYDPIYILFHTGMRISEFVGLTLSDVDSQNRIINIDHQLQRKRDMTYIIEDTKTTSGTRQLPMTEDVYACFKRIIENRPSPKIEPTIQGKSGFLYLDKNGMPMVALHWEKYFEHICEKYNGLYKEQLPKITPHVCRHTYCSNMAKRGMNPKTLQLLMGHRDLCTTLGTYTHFDLEDIRKELKKVENQ